MHLNAPFGSINQVCAEWPRLCLMHTTHLSLEERSWSDCRALMADMKTFGEETKLVPPGVAAVIFGDVCVCAYNQYHFPQLLLFHRFTINWKERATLKLKALPYINPQQKTALQTHVGVNHGARLRSDLSSPCLRRRSTAGRTAKKRSRWCDSIRKGE